jgi:hypothetical protein
MLIYFEKKRCCFAEKVRLISSRCSSSSSISLKKSLKRVAVDGLCASMCAYDNVVGYMTII